MQTSSLKEIDGSLILEVPAAVREQLQLHAGNVVHLAVEGERLIVETRKRPKYTMEELLAQCSPDDPLTDEDREWLDAPPVGREL